jgi:general secretion pathway protein B
MSFILDALKKSENDRQRLKGPALFEVKVAPPRNRWPMWGVAIGILLGVNLLVVAWLLLRSPSPAEPPSAQPAASTAAPTSPAVATPALPPPAPPPPSPAVLQPPVPAASDVGPALNADTNRLAGAETMPLDVPSDDYAPAIEADEEAPASLVTRATASGLPSYDQLAERETMPELRLDMHVFAPQRQDRFVFVNMRRLKEGETMPEGVRVVTITPDGAVLDFRGRQFVLQRQ